MKKKNISNILKAKFHPITLRNKVKPTFKYCIQVVPKSKVAMGIKKKKKVSLEKRNKMKQNES